MTIKDEPFESDDVKAPDRCQTRDANRQADGSSQPDPWMNAYASCLPDAFGFMPQQNVKIRCQECYDASTQNASIDLGSHTSNIAGQAANDACIFAMRISVAFHYECIFCHANAPPLHQRGPGPE
jgi:hypothetical protein